MMLRKIRRFPRLARKAIRLGLGWSESPPSSWQKRVAYYPLHEVYRLGKRVVVRPRMCSHITRGTAADGSGPLAVAFIGAWGTEREPAMDRYEQALFQAGSAVRQEGDLLSGSLRQQAETLAAGVDLVLAVGAESNLWQPAGGNWVIGPAGLRRTFEFAPGEPWQAFLERLGPQSPIARVRGSGLRYSISRRYTDLSTFLEQMYFPQAERQKRDFGERMTEAEARELFEEHRTLLWVEDPQGWLVAGALMYPLHQVMHTCLRGAAAAEGMSDPALADGSGLAQAAIDYFGLKWAHASGCLRYDAGLVLPFLTQGPADAQARLLPDPFHHDSLLVWAPEGRQAGLNWLLAHPLEPGSAREGGSELSELYQSLRNRPAQPVPQMQAIPNTAASAAKQGEDFCFTLQSRAAFEDQRTINHGLFDHALAAIGPEWGRNYQPLSIMVRDQAGKVVGGLIGRITWNYMHIDSLWVSEDLRGLHIGSRIMEMAERTARAERVKVMLLETTDFEARSFYPRLGFEEVAAFPGVPPDHVFYIMKKVLD